MSPTNYMRPGGQPAALDFYEHVGARMPTKLPAGYQNPEPGLQAPAVDPVDLFGPGLLKGGIKAGASPFIHAARRSALAKEIPELGQAFQAMGNPITNTWRWLSGSIDDAIPAGSPGYAMSAAERIPQTFNQFGKNLNKFRGSWGIKVPYQGRDPRHVRAVLEGPKEGIQELSRLLVKDPAPVFGRYHNFGRLRGSGPEGWQGDIAAYTKGRGQTLVHEAAGHAGDYRLRGLYGGPQSVSDAMQQGVARRAGVGVEGIVPRMENEMRAVTEGLVSQFPDVMGWTSRYSPDRWGGEAFARAIAGQLGPEVFQRLASRPLYGAMMTEAMDVLPRQLKTTPFQAIADTLMPSVSAFMEK